MNTKLSLALLVCCGLVAVVMGQDRGYETVHTAGLNKGRKTIDANFGGYKDHRAENAKLAVMRDSVNLLLMNQKERMNAKAAGNTAVAGKGAEQVVATKTSDTAVKAQSADGKAVSAAANGPNAVQAADAAGQKVAASGVNDRAMAIQGRQRAQGALVRDGTVVRGGTAQQGANQAKMGNQMVNGQKVANLEANRRYNANAAAVSRNRFNVKTGDKQEADSRGLYGLNSAAASEQAGNGMVNANQKDGKAVYNYKYQQDSQGEGVASLDQVGAGSGVFDRRTTGWKCTAVKDGESTCLDANGEIVGKVLANAKGGATVMDKNGVVVGRGVVNKVSDEKYEVVVSDGLASASTERLTQYDCYSEVKPGQEQKHKVVIDDVKVKVDGEEVDGTQTFTWPSCFDIEADVTIPAGVDPARLAFEYVGHVMPLGNMKCMDSMTCGRGCYYCNACEKETLLGDKASLTTGESNAVCDLHGGAGKQTVSMRVCPPAEVEKAAFCGGFDRHIVGNDYYKYDGSINAQIRVWLRPENEAQMRTNFFTQMSLPIAKTALQNAWKLDNKVLSTPTDNELLEFYVRKNGEEQLMACRRGVVDYNVGGSKVNSNIMIDAFTNVPGGQIKLLSDAPCDDWLSAQEKEYDAYLKEYQNSQGSATNSLSSVFGSFLGGRGGRRA